MLTEFDGSRLRVGGRPLPTDLYQIMVIHGMHGHFTSDAGLCAVKSININIEATVASTRLVISILFASQRSLTHLMPYFPFIQPSRHHHV